MAIKLGMINSRQEAARISSTGKRRIDQYGMREEAAVRALGAWTVPPMYQYPRPTQLSHALTHMAVDPAKLAQFHRDGATAFRLNNPAEVAVLQSKHAGRIRRSLKATPSVRNAKLRLD